MARLEEGGAAADAVVAEMESFRAALVAPGLLRIHIIGDMLRQPKPLTPFVEAALHGFRLQGQQGSVEDRAAAGCGAFAPVAFSNSLLLPSGGSGGGAAAAAAAAAGQQRFGAILEMPAVENSNVVVSIPGPSSFTDKDYPALMVLTEYLTGLEGPFWRQIRGQVRVVASSLEAPLSLFSLFSPFFLSCLPSN